MERFWAKAKRVESGCLEWQGYQLPAGYGRFRLDGRLELAHRVAYSWVKGRIPVGFEVDHTCKNPSCVDPSHLQAIPQGTHRTKDLSGEGNGQSKLTQEDAEYIRTASLSNRAMAQRFGVSERHIRRVKQRARWNHAPSITV